MMYKQMNIEQLHAITEQGLVRLIKSFHLLLCYILSDLHSAQNFEKPYIFIHYFKDKLFYLDFLIKLWILSSKHVSGIAIQLIDFTLIIVHHLLMDAQYGNTF